jgi:hypothetical protein
LSLNLTISNGTLEKFELFGTVNITEELNDLDSTTEVFQCSLDMKHCNRYPAPKYTNFCERLEARNVIFAGVLDSITPKILSCPLKVGFYNISKVSFDFPPVFSIIPLEKYAWVATFKYSDEKSRSLKACISFEAKFLRKRIRD